MLLGQSFKRYVEMVEETNSQVNNSVVDVADDGYEYEYIELAEGEELPEGAEYEYEYVEVPVDENGQVIEDSNVFYDDANYQPEEGNDTSKVEDIPQFLQESKDMSSDFVLSEETDDEKVEPHLSVENSDDVVESSNISSSFETDDNQSVLPEDTKIPDFLQEGENSVNIDDILDDEGRLKRKYLASIAFTDAENEKTLNDITHKGIKRQLEAEIEANRQKGERIMFLEGPILFEAGVDKDAIDDVTALAHAYMEADEDLDLEDAIEKVVKKYPHFKKGADSSDDADDTKGKSWGERQRGTSKKRSGVEAAFLAKNPGLKID